MAITPPPPLQPPPPSFWRSRLGQVWVVAVVIGGIYLFAEHEAHLYQVLPYLVLLACPLIHLFMHRGHRHGRHRGPHHQHPDEGRDGPSSVDPQGR